MAQKRKNSKKYRLTCVAPGELTQYNLDYNQSISDTCTQDMKFEPHISCAGCKYLEIKKLT